MRCGCLGPCGKGPNVSLTMDGVRLKDVRTGKKNRSIWSNVDSPEVASSMLKEAGISVPNQAIDKVLKIEIKSSRTFWDFDRTTRIAFQRLLYILVGLPLLEAYKQGNWDMIHGVLYPNSYSIFMCTVFIGSQFM